MSRQLSAARHRRLARLARTGGWTYPPADSRPSREARNLIPTTLVPAHRHVRARPYHRRRTIGGTRERQPRGPILTALAAAFLAAILAVLGSRWVAGFQADKDAKQREADRELQREESRRQDERHLRDLRRERIRSDYEAIVFAATEIQGASVQLGILWRGDTEEARNDRVNKRLEDATGDLGRAIARLRIEEGAQPLVDAYNTVRGLWFSYADYLLPQQRYGDIADTLTKMNDAVDGILAKAKADLDALSKPI